MAGRSLLPPTLQIASSPQLPAYGPTSADPSIDPWESAAPPPRADSNPDGLDSSISTLTNADMIAAKVDQYIRETYELNKPDAWRRYIPKEVKPGYETEFEQEARAQASKDLARAEANLNRALSQQQRIGGPARPMTPLQQAQLSDIQDKAAQRARNTIPVIGPDGNPLMDPETGQPVTRSLGTDADVLRYQQEQARLQQGQQRISQQDYQNAWQRWWSQYVHAETLKYQEEIRKGKSIDQAQRTWAQSIAAGRQAYDQAMNWQQKTIIGPFEHMKTLANQQFNIHAQDIASQRVFDRGIYNTQVSSATQTRNNDLNNARQGGEKMMDAYFKALDKFAPEGTADRMLQVVIPWMRKKGLTPPKEWAARYAEIGGGVTNPDRQRTSGIPVADEPGMPDRGDFSFSGRGVGPSEDMPTPPTPQQRSRSPFETPVDMPSSPREAWRQGAMDSLALADLYPRPGPMQPQVPTMRQVGPAPDIAASPFGDRGYGGNGYDVIGPPPAPDLSNVPADVVRLAQMYYPGQNYGQSSNYDYGDTGLQPWSPSLFQDDQPWSPQQPTIYGPEDNF